MKKPVLSAFALLSGIFSFSQNSIPIGQSSNAYGMLRTSQNQVFVCPSMNVVGFIFRHNVALYAQTSADNGRLRYSISTNAVVTWETELGVLNDTYTRKARFPESYLYNPIGNTNPSLAYIVWSAPTLPADFDGLVNGTCEVSTSNPVTTTENYQFQNTGTSIPGGLTESTSGVFWMVENATTVDTVFIDSINVYKGTFSSGNVNWVKHTSLYSPHSTSYDGNPHLTGPNMAFSNDGQTGYIVFLGDIGMADTTYNPIIYKSTDAGTTWSSANELHIDSIAGIGDSIKQYLFDTGTAIESCTEVATAFDFDITVDVNDNLHIFTTVCAVERTDTFGVVTGVKQYTVWSAYPKNAVDIYSTDGGITWTSLYVAQINQFRTTVASPPGTLGIDNYNQISRTTDGTILFYSWSDTDTLIHNTATTNEAPNTFIAGFNVLNGKRTCWKQVTAVQNEENAISPTMAPYVLEGLNGGPEYTLPIVTQELPIDALSATVYYYVGKGAKFCDEEFMDANTLDLSWSFASPCYGINNVTCFAAGIDEQKTIIFNIYPNPAVDILNIGIENGENINNISVLNNLGQVIKTILPGDLDENNIFNIDITRFAAGMYIINISTHSKTYSKKFTVAK